MLDQRGGTPLGSQRRPVPVLPDEIRYAVIYSGRRNSQNKLLRQQAALAVLLLVSALFALSSDENNLFCAFHNLFCSSFKRKHSQNKLLTGIN
jgi:hypothetical protein